MQISCSAVLFQENLKGKLTFTNLFFCHRFVMHLYQQISADGVFLWRFSVL